MLKLENISLKIKNKKLLKNISFNLDNWKSLALMWHNWSGKTTILKSIMWLYKISWWKIIFNNEEIQDLAVSERSKKGIWYIMQEIPEYAGISVETYMKWILKDKYDETYITKQFSIFGLDFKIYKNRNFDSKLSWWEKKKIEIITTFMLDRQLYLLDEVETGLDVTSRDILKTMILEEMKLWKSFIIVSHYEDLIKIAQNWILLCNGKIQNEWPVEQIFQKYTWKCENCEIQNNCK